MFENCLEHIDGMNFIRIKDILEFIYENKHVCNNVGRIICNDPILQNYCAKVKCDTLGGSQDCWVIDLKGIPYYLYKLNIKNMTSDELDRYKSIFYYFTEDDIRITKDNFRGYYFSELLLRDEIYDMGYLNGIKIVDKEVIFEFGRIDLYGIDENNKKCCIELKN